MAVAVAAVAVRHLEELTTVMVAVVSFPVEVIVMVIASGVSLFSLSESELLRPGGPQFQGPGWG